MTLAASARMVFRTDTQCQSRLRCRHGFHSICWVGVVQALGENPRTALVCPMCREETSPLGLTRVSYQFDRLRHDHNHRYDLNYVAPAVAQQVPSDSDGTWQIPIVGTASGPTDTNTPDTNPSLYITDSASFVTSTSLKNGRIGMIVDPGSVWDLAGSEWAKSVAQAAAANGLSPSFDRRASPLNISGVGNGSQQCTFDCHLPVALRTVQGEKRTGMMHTPTVIKSHLPGLLGLNALKRNRAVLDVNTNKLYFLGPGDYDLDKAMPPGTDIIQCESAPSGHIILPCCEHDASMTVQPQHPFSLHAKRSPQAGTTGRVIPDGASRPRQQACNSGSNASSGTTRTVPKPPDAVLRRVTFSEKEVPPPPQHPPSI